MYTVMRRKKVKVMYVNETNCHYICLTYAVYKLNGENTRFEYMRSLSIVLKYILVSFKINLLASIIAACLDTFWIRGSRLQGASLCCSVKPSYAILAGLAGVLDPNQYYILSWKLLSAWKSSRGTWSIIKSSYSFNVWVTALFCDALLRIMETGAYL